MSVLDKINELFAGEADYDKLSLLREARDELDKCFMVRGKLLQLNDRLVGSLSSYDQSLSEHYRDQVAKAAGESHG